MATVKMTKQEWLPFWLISWLDAWGKFGEQFSEPDPKQTEENFLWALTVRLRSVEKSA